MWFGNAVRNVFAAAETCRYIEYVCVTLWGRETQPAGNVLMTLANVIHTLLKEILCDVKT